MRSRYVAYSQGNIAYLTMTLSPDMRGEFRAAAALQWASTARFTNLKIVATALGGGGDDTGTVTFIATYIQNGHTIDHHEISRFIKDDFGHWMFVDGQSHQTRVESAAAPFTAVAPATRAPKIGRNAPCTCGSGKKFKVCCGRS